jgi:copper chaperone CopZ
MWKQISTLALLSWVISSHAAEPVRANATNQFRITGMFCEGCAGGITSELKRTAGVTYVNVSLTNKLALVAYDTNRVTTSNLVHVVKEAGYTAEPITKR